MLSHSVPHFLPNSGVIACCVFILTLSKIFQFLLKKLGMYSKVFIMMADIFFLYITDIVHLQVKFEDNHSLQLKAVLYSRINHLIIDGKPI